MIITIRSGRNYVDVSVELDAVAQVAEQALGDATLANRVHSVLNEAMLNVSMHAYDPQFYTADEGVRDRWWVAGLGNAENNEVILFAYDLGVGIAKTAPVKLGADLQGFLDEIMMKIGLKGPDARDHHIIEAAIKSRKSRTGKAQHGKGLTSMIQLIDRAPSGTIWISSGGGQYLYAKSDRAGQEPMELATPLEYSVPGTLIVWQLRGAAATKGPLGDANAA